MTGEAANPKTDSDREEGADLPWRFTTSGVLFLAGIKIFDGLRAHFFGMVPMFLVSFIQDLFLLLLVYFLWRTGDRLFPGSRKITRGFFFAAFLPLLLFNGLYSPFLSDLQNFPLNLFAVELNLALFFWRNFLTGKRVLLIGAWFLVFLATSLRGNPGPGPGPRLKKACWLVSFIAIVTLLANPINPLLFSAAEEYRGFFSGKRAGNVRRLAPPNPIKGGSRGNLDRSFTDYPKIAPCYDRVVLFVMESIPFRSFAGRPADIEALDPTGKGSWRSFSRYHTTNLDSFTSLLAILNSVFIPFQAYVNEEKYRFLDHGENLVRFFSGNGFKTHFVTSFGSHQIRFAPDVPDWTDLHFVEDVRADPRFICVTSNPVEWAAEDLAALEPLLARLASAPRVFIFQEMVYGHTPEWVARTGKTPLEYYRAYFRKFFVTAAARNLLDRTLVVICSDHGPREDQWEPESYHIPLLFWASGLASGTDDRFLCHLDLKDLLLEELGRLPGPKPRSETWLVGHSGEYLYGRLLASGGGTLISNHSLNVKSSESPEEVAAFHQAFQAYLHAFSSKDATEAQRHRE